jgi:hypothetical protein
MLLAFATACPKPPSFDALPSGQPLAVDDARALAVAAEHRDRTRHSRALRGSARVVLEGPDFKLNRPQRIAIARPGKLRFEVLGLFDVLAAMLVSDGREFGFFDASSGEVTRGPMTPDLLWELAQLDLEADEVVDLLLATPTPSQELGLAGIWLDPDAGLTFAFSRIASTGDAEVRPPCAGLSLDGSGERDVCTGSIADLELGAEIFRFDAHGLLREVRAVDPGWITRYRASFEDYADVAGEGFGSAHSEGRSESAEANAGGLERDRSMHLFPMRITVHSPRVEAMARFEWKRIMLTDELPDRLFRLPEIEARETASGG